MEPIEHDAVTSRRYKEDFDGLLVEAKKTVEASANDPQSLTAIQQAWADRCGISYDDERAKEPHLYGWPEKYAIFRDGWDAACLYAAATRQA